MINTRLIMMEGLPGLGKSTNAQFVLMQLERNGYKAKWIHEVARPHPVLFFDEACLTQDAFRGYLRQYPHAAQVLEQCAVVREKTVAFDLLDIEWNHLKHIGQDAFEALRKFDVWHCPLEEYTQLALEKWRGFVQHLLSADKSIYILDSAIFQFQLFTFLLKKAPYEEIECFIQKLIEIIQPLHPMLVYLYHENTQSAIDSLVSSRGMDFLERIWERDREEPYYQDKPRGARGQMCFLREYADMAMRLFHMAACKKTAIEVSGKTWDVYENKLLASLGIERLPPCEASPPNGIFRNSEWSFQMTVKGMTVQDPDGKTRRLTPQSSCAFYVEELPVVLDFGAAGSMVMAGGQIGAQWTTTGLVYNCVEQTLR